MKRFNFDYRVSSDDLSGLAGLWESAEEVPPGIDSAGVDPDLFFRNAEAKQTIQKTQHDVVVNIAGVATNPTLDDRIQAANLRRSFETQGNKEGDGSPRLVIEGMDHLTDEGPEWNPDEQQMRFLTHLDDLTNSSVFELIEDNSEALPENLIAYKVMFGEVEATNLYVDIAKRKVLMGEKFENSNKVAIRSLNKILETLSSIPMRLRSDREQLLKPAGDLEFDFVLAPELLENFFQGNRTVAQIKHENEGEFDVKTQSFRVRIKPTGAIDSVVIPFLACRLRLEQLLAACKV